MAEFLMKLIVVTSPATDAGKTFLATGLTEVSASRDYKTVYVDLDKPVGDSLRVFGLRHKKDIPTITTYYDYDIDDYAKTPAGAYILPKPDNINENFSVSDAEDLIISLKNNFDIAIIDLGASLEAPFWKSFVEQANLSLLVTDCDDKALYRIEELLSKSYAKPHNGYTLLINDREGKNSFYSPHQIYRTLSNYEEISNTFKIPYFKNLEKKNPKTFSPNEKFAEDILRLILSSQTDSDFKLLESYIPKKETEAKEVAETKIIEKETLPITTTEKKIKQVKTEIEETTVEPVQVNPIKEEFVKREEKEKTNRKIKEPRQKREKQIKKSKKEKETKGLGFFSRFFCKTGYIKDGKFIKYQANTIEELISLHDKDINSIVIPASWGYEPIKKYRRKKETRTIPLVVVKGSTQHILVGADKCVRKVNTKTLQDITAYSMELVALWESATIEPKTGLYTREVYHQWLEKNKNQERIFSVAFFDIDKFKSVNDNYGHDIGDLVLYQFAQFLKNNTREQDITIRWGGEEFIVVLPDTNARQGYVMIDRLREMWAEKAIFMPDGQVLKSTFSAGVAQYKEGHDVVDEADKLMYQAKNSGRNKVMLSRAAIQARIALLGSIPINKLSEKGYQVVTDYKDADCIISDVLTLTTLPENIIPSDITLYILGSGKPSDLKIKRSFPSSMLFNTLEGIIDHIEGTDDDISSGFVDPEEKSEENIVTEEFQPKEKTVISEELPNKTSKITVLPGVRTSKTNLTLPKGGVVFIACPSRPAIASELASKLALSITNVALVCAAPESTAALNIGLTVNDLIESDWRFPRAIAPLHQAGVYVWPVDPYKHTNPITPYDVHRLIEQIKHKFNLVLVDCCGSLSYCSRVAHDEAIMVIKKEGDMSDLATSQWLTNYGGKNVLEVSPIETPIITEVENGLLIDTRSIDCKENS